MLQRRRVAVFVTAHVHRSSIGACHDHRRPAGGGATLLRPARQEGREMLDQAGGDFYDLALASPPLAQQQKTLCCTR